MSQPRCEMKPFFALLLTIVMFSLLGCNNDAPPARKPEPCQKIVEYTVYGRNDSILYHEVVQAELKFGEGQRRPNNSFLLYPLQEERFSESNARLQKIMGKANRNLTQFFAGPPVTSMGGFYSTLEIGYHVDGTLVENVSQACQQPSSFTAWFGSGLEYYTGDTGHRYRTSLKFVGETVYVTSALHETGSKVTYSFPA